MRRFALAILTLALAAVVAAGLLRKPATMVTPLEQLRARTRERPAPSVDHSRLAPLQRTFDTPQDVTRACVSCHTERAREVMASSHWNWEREEFIPGHGIRRVGKRNILNNYCIGVTGNLESCDKCHAGYGFVDEHFDFGNPDNVDCLACHDNSGSYARAGNGMPAPSVDLTAVAQHVGRPRRDNCGACHFGGGGGNNVKHGDLEEALLQTTRDIDVHMAADGADLQCVDCHTATNHRMLGKLYSVSSMNRNRSSCEQCHGATPHGGTILDEHTLKVACQTCHIPEYAKANATKTSWDWSTAGRLRDGAPYEERDAEGNITYASIKGTFTWGRNLRPAYAWFNGTAGHYLLGDTVADTGVVKVNVLQGSYADPDAKIIPVKVHRGRQLFDPGTGMLVQPKLFARETGQGAYWKDFDWDAAARAGMEAAGLPYSGQRTFVETEMYWPVNHMVAPKEDAVRCVECHTREGSRLAGLRDFYMPGRDRSPLVDRMGAGFVLLSVAGIVVHGGARVAASARRRKRRAS